MDKVITNIDRKKAIYICTKNILTDLLNFEDQQPSDKKNIVLGRGAGRELFERKGLDTTGLALSPSLDNGRPVP